MKKGWRQTAFRRSGNIKNLPRHLNGRGALLRLIPAILVILAAVILPSPAVCGDNPSAVTESSRTYKDPVCNFMVKDLENEIAETTTSLKNCGTQSSLSPKAAAARAKECEQYERKLKLTKENLLHVKEQCDKGLTPGYLPRVIENPGAVPCAQCGANKPLPQEPSAKVLTGLPVSGKVMDLKAGDPVLAAVAGKSRAPAAIGVIPEPVQQVLCVCPDGRSLGWMYLSECTAMRVTSCGAIQPPIVPPPTEPPPVVQPPTEPPSTGQPPPVVQPPAKKSGFLDTLKTVINVVLGQIKTILTLIRDVTQGALVAVRNWIFNKPDYATVVCDGNGGYKIQLNEFEGAPCGIEECALKHEQTHIDHLNAVYQGSFSPCAGVKAGTQVPLSNPAFINFTECAAYSGEIECLGGRLHRGQSFYCRSKLSGRIAKLNETKGKLKCP